ncbi:hypothetical protein FIU82_18420 (plasmid) [Pseudoalteromonas sp. THAF3]|nr:hypothetical protein FIU82_18420 [Pseudoalteromonas sp. THAF3]
MYTVLSANTNNSTLLTQPLVLGACFGRGVVLACMLFALNAALLLSGSLGDAIELEALMGEGLSQEPWLVAAMQFFAQPVLSAQLLIGLCWLLFHFFAPKRAAISLRKAAFDFVAPTRCQNPQGAHGCRAPPSVAG